MLTEAAHANALNTLAQLVRAEAEALLAQWRKRVRALPSARHLDVPTLNDHMPLLLEELALAFEGMSGPVIAEVQEEGTPKEHGSQRVHDGFDINEVVSEYNILRGCVHDLADKNGITLQGTAFHVINRVFDGAIGLAVKTYADERAVDIRRRREEYLAFVAHDLRTPLNAISLVATGLQEMVIVPSGNADGVRMMTILRRNVGQLETLVAKVLEENSQLQEEDGVKLERRRFELWPLVGSVLMAVKPVAASAGTRLLNEVPDDVMVLADAGLLRRILQNLVANAITYTPSGEVRVGAQPLPDGKGTECWVGDTGTGIPAHLFDTIFEKGTGDPARPESTGLGLTIVKTFVEAHGGTVRAESREGEGCTIRFTLPDRAE